MQIRRTFALVVAAMFALAAPAVAQGKGHGKGGGKGAAKAGQGAVKAGGKGTAHKAAPAQRGRGQVKKVQAAARRMPDNQLHAQKPAKAEVKQHVGNGRATARGQQKLTGREKQDAKRIEQSFGGEVRRGNALGKTLGRGRFTRVLEFNDIAPPVRRYVVSARPEERLLGKAVALAFVRGVPDNALVIVPTGPRYFVRNEAGDVLLDLEESHARNPGYWKVVTIDDRVNEKAPSFCRSGAGHPVWGRQWCLDKGFGLGRSNDYRWARTVDPSDVVFRSAGTGSLTRDVLETVLGNTVLNRLGLHALTLGYTDPLTGQWLGQGTAPRVLLVSSGVYPIAEIVDTNGDNRADNLLVALRPW